MRSGAPRRAGLKRDARIWAMAWRRSSRCCSSRGEVYQFDWSHEDVEIAGKPMRVKVPHLLLCASRPIDVRA